MKLKIATGSLLLLAITVVVVGIAVSQLQDDSQTAAAQSSPHPMAMRPFGDDELGAPRAAGEPRQLDLADLTEPGAVAWGTALVEIIDTTTHQQVQNPVDRPDRRVKELLPPHESQWMLPLGPPNDLQAGVTLDTTRVSATAAFPGISNTGWTPPDPIHAVGPSHIVSTVNMSLAFYAKDGTLEYSNDLGDAGNPGFFEPLGAGGFTFDPKCFYDHIADRFIVLALEVYGSTESWITFAVSDDSDPNGIRYKYRTDVVISVSGTTYWWDYPGLGYDDDAYYVTGNLFGLSAGGWAGVGFRVINKADVLVGDPAVYTTLRDGNAASVQVGQHFGSNLAPFFVSTYSSSALQIHAITHPTTAPALTGTLPFTSQFWVQLDNLTSENRRAALRIDVTIGNGGYYSNWRSGWMNLGPDEVFSTNWLQNFPALGSLVGDNVFEVIGEDVTPSPYNQPPYAFSGDTDIDTATVTASN